jgi:DNA-binding transcriptional regulator GbsR (MarR family)
MKMTPAVEKYVLHWGEMGTRWGTNRTVAQIQALLYLSPQPLRADEIVVWPGANDPRARRPQRLFRITH